MNSVVQAHRSIVPNDLRTDEEITLLYGDAYPGKYDDLTDFSADYDKLSRARRLARAPSLAVEAARGLRRGVDSLQGTIYGAGALAAGALGIDSAKDALLRKAREQEEEAALNPPTIEGVRDVGSVGEGVRYLAGGAGEVVPSLVEAGATGLAGAALGTAVEPVGGTAAGLLSGIIGRQAVKSLLKKGIREASEEIVKQEAKAIAQRYGAGLLTALNSYALSSGEVYSDLTRNQNVSPDTAINTSLLGGLVAAVPDTFLPSYVIGKFFRGVPTDEANRFVLRIAKEAATTLPAESLTEGFQELVGIAAEKYADPTKRDAPLSKHDFDRILNAAAIGGIGGLIAAPIAAAPGGRPKTQPKPINETAAEILKKVDPEVSAVYAGAVPTERKVELAEVVAREVAGQTTPTDTATLRTANEQENAQLALMREASKSISVESDESYGGGEIPQYSELGQRVQEAAAKTDTNPTDAQKKAGNYRKGTVAFEGLEIAIENPKGSVRSGVDRDGKAWSVEMPAIYGYVKGTEGRDGDAVDVYIGPNPELDQVFVIDQVDAETGKFDETKTMLGFPSQEAAVAAYDAAFSDGKGPQRRSAVTSVTKDQFKEWIKERDTTKPFASTKKLTPPEPAEPAPIVAPTAPTAPPEPPPIAEPIVEATAAVASTPGEIDVTKIAEEFADQIDVAGGISTYTGHPFETKLEDPRQADSLYGFSKQMVKGARGKKIGAINNDKGYTHRALFVRDLDTGKIVAVGTYDNNGEKAVDPAGGRFGISLKTLVEMKSKADPNTPRYQPLASARMLEARKGFRREFTEEQFAAIQEEALARIGHEYSRAPKMQAKGFSEVGEEIEGATEDSYTPNDMDREFRDVIVENLPRDKNGAIRSDLTISDIKEMLVTAFEDPENSDVRNHALREVIGGLSKDRDFLALDNVSKQRAIVEGIARLVYEQYKLGGFTERPQPVPPLAESAGGSRLEGDAKSGAQEGSEATPGQQESESKGGNQVPDRARPLNFRQPADDPNRETSETIRAAFLDVLSVLSNSGIDVSIFQQQAGGIVDDFLKAEGGAYDNAANMMALVMRDITNPTRENYRTLLHEVAHALFGQEPTGIRQSIANAINAASDAQLGITESADPRISESNPAGLDPEKLAEERLAEHLALGFAPEQARGIARQLFNLLKELVLRAAMAIQTAMFGAHGVSPKLALEYFRTKMDRLIYGSRSLSFIDFLGGPRLRNEEKAALFTPSNGQTVAAKWNPETGEYEFEDILMDSPEAARWKVSNLDLMFRRPRGLMQQVEPSPDTDSAELLPDFAANNAVLDAMQGMFKVWTDLGHNRSQTGEPLLDFDGFAQWVLGRSSDPRKNIADGNEQLAALGKHELNPAVRISDLNEHSTKEAASKAHYLLRKFIDQFNERQAKAAFETSGKPGSLQAKLDRARERIDRLTKEYTDADLIFSEVRAALLESFLDLREDANQIGKSARKVGLLTQMIHELEGRIDRPIGRQYGSVINKLYKQLTGDPMLRRRFMDMLSYLANQDIDWSQIKVSEVRTILSDVASRFDLLGPLGDSSPEGKALLAMVASFAHSNSVIMNVLAVRLDETGQEREQVNKILQHAKRDHAEALQEARALAKRLPRLASVASRLLDNLEGAKAENRRTLDALKRHNELISLHRETRRILAEQLARVEKILGAVDIAFEAIEGAEFIYPENPDAATENIQWVKDTFHQTRDGKLTGDLKAKIAKMQKWFNRVGPDDPMRGSVTYNRIDVQIKKLLENAVAGEHQSIKRSFIIRLFGSIADKMHMIGHPAAVSIARRVRSYVSLIDGNKAKAEAIGIRWANSEAKAMKALGYSLDRVADFRKRFLNRALEYIEGRKDLLSAAANLEDAQNSVLREVRPYLAANPKTSEALSKPGAWQALEEYIRATAQASTEMMEIAQKMGLRIEDGLNGIFRETKGAPMFEVMRRVSDKLKNCYDAMAIYWLNFPDQRSIASAYENSPDQLRQSLAVFFGDQVWRDFLGPLALKENRALFYAAKEEAEQNYRLAKAHDVQQAYQLARGDVVSFAEILFEITGGTVDKAGFVAETLSTVKAFFDVVHGIHQKQAEASKFNIESVQHLLMDARKAEEFPAEWLEYRTFDMHSARGMLNSLAHHAAFGRDMAAVLKDFDTAEAGLQRLERKLKEIDDRTKQTHEKYRRRREEMKRLAGNSAELTRLENAARDLALLRSEREALLAFVRSQSGLAMEMKPWAELLSAGVGIVVQGPGTALVDTISMFKPVSEMGLSTQTLTQVGKSLTSFGAENLNSFLQVFGRTAKFNADYHRRRHALGYYDTDAQFKLKERIRAIIQSTPPVAGETIGGKISRGVTLASRIARALSGAGVGRGESASFRPLAPFTQVGMTMNAAAVDGVWKTYEDMVLRAIGHFQGHPDDLNSQTFQFEAKHLGYTKRFFGLINDEDAFQYQKTRLEHYGMTLEALARDAIDRRSNDPNAPLLRDEFYQRLASIAPNEVTLESSIATRPTGLVTNPVLHFALPLVGWSISQMVSVAKTFRGPNFELDRKAVLKGLRGMSAMVPIALAYALLRDEYDEEILGKKSNVLSFGEDNFALAFIDKMARVGTFGLAGDFANSMINIDTAREFSVDSRVFAVSSLLATMRTVGAWYQQGGDATYASVWRPLAQALGGSGYLQYAQILNNAFSLDNAEARVTSRINAQNYLRSVGRELKLDVRTGRGMTSLPNPIKPWISEMVLASYANDALGFNEAYRMAINAARAEGKPDPVDHVKRSFQAYHPLRSVFRTAPSEAEYQRILYSLSSDGRDAVSEAVNHFNAFSRRLGISEFNGKESKTERKKVSQRFSVDDFLRRASEQRPLTARF